MLMAASSQPRLLTYAVLPVDNLGRAEGVFVGVTEAHAMFTPKDAHGRPRSIRPVGNFGPSGAAFAGVSEAQLMYAGGPAERARPGARVRALPHTRRARQR